MIQWNKEEGSELISQIPRIIYDTFGRDNVLVYDNDYDVIPYSIEIRRGARDRARLRRAAAAAGSARR